MALTKGSTTYLQPYAQQASGKSGTILSLPAKSSDAIRKGDIVVLASGVADPVDNNQADGAVFGVALNAKASGTYDYTDQVLVACALPGALFEGSLTAGAATDYTANAAAAIVSRYDTVLGTDSYTGYLLIDSGTTATGQIRTIMYSPNQMGGKTFTVFGNTAIVNPRVIFCFRSSAFQSLA